MINGRKKQQIKETETGKEKNRATEIKKKCMS